MEEEEEEEEEKQRNTFQILSLASKSYRLRLLSSSCRAATRCPRSRRELREEAEGKLFMKLKRDLAYSSRPSVFPLV
jgi:hypothetical protein